MGQVAEFLETRFVLVAVGLALLSALLVAIGWGQGAAFAVMILGGLLMWHTGVGHPTDATEE